MARRRPLPTPEPPAEIAAIDGLAYSLWRPPGEPLGGLLVLPGAGSRKEHHHDMARAARAAGFTALAADLRGHGDSTGVLDARVLADLGALAALLPRPLALRGSSMGGYLALVAAEALGAAAVVAICPASAAGLARGVRDRRFAFRADAESVLAFLAEHDEGDAAAALEIPVLLMHAEGDAVVPVAHSRALAGRLRHPASRLVAVPGGHHGSVQHDAELQGVALRWLRRALGAGGGDPAGSGDGRHR